MRVPGMRHDIGRVLSGGPSVIGFQERLFSRYFRAPEVRDTVIAGTGLGLSISREIMRAFGGDIRISSELREGTTVTLVFPLAAIEESETTIA